MSGPRALTLLAIVASTAWAVWQWSDPSLNEGWSFAHAHAIVDRGGLFIDVLAATLAAVLLMFSHEQSRHSNVSVLLSLFGIVAVNHSGDLVGIFLGFELLLLSAWLRRSEHHRESDAQFSRGVADHCMGTAMLAFGLALVYLGLSTLRLEGMSGRVSVVFTQWGAIQPHVDALNAGGSIPAGLAAQARDKVVTGTAAAAIFLPGLLLVLTAVLVRCGAFAWLTRSKSPHPGDDVWGATVLPALAGLAILIRVFVAVMHAPRLIGTPYGWVGALPFLASATVIISAWQALRTRDLMNWGCKMFGVQFGLSLFAICAAATFHGRGGSGSLEATETTEWARQSGDMAVAAVLGTIAAASLNLTSLAAAAAACPGIRQFESMSKAIQHRPFAMMFSALAVASAAGLPFTPSFWSDAELLAMLARHSSLASFLPVLAVGLAIAGVSGIRVLSLLIAPPGPGSSDPGPGDRGGWITAAMILLALLTLALAVSPATLRSVASEAASGSAMPAGTAARARWVAR